MAAETTIHPSAIVDQGAKLGVGVTIGPLCHVGAEVEIGDHTTLMGQVTVRGATSLGEGGLVYPQAVLGCAPQNTKHRGGRTTLTIGRRCTIREFVTMHVGTDTARGTTTIGDDGHFLAYSHVAHDCSVGDQVTLTNGATLGGHCEIGNRVSIGGLSAVHQFVRVGDNAFLAGGSMIVGDVIPFGIAMGNRAKLRGLNVVGLRRQGYARSDIQTLRSAFRMIFDPSRPMAQGVEAARSAFPHSVPVGQILDFLTSRGKRHFCVPPLNRRDEDPDDDG